jgi:pyrroloquinoline quinone (PQQ) biosynthesis protein C
MNATMDGMYPFLPADALISTRPGMYTLDGQQFPLTTEEAERLSELAPLLNGRLPLRQAVQSAQDATLLQRLHACGGVFDLRVAGNAVHTRQYCDYLYARISGWRTHKRPDDWPWRAVIAHGQATVEYLQGILIENYHYVRAAAVRQSPLLSRAASSAVFDLIRDFVTGEAAHEQYFLATLTRWGLPERDVRQTVPLTATATFIALQYRLAHLSILDYLAGSAALEVDPQVYERQGDPYQDWAATYRVDPEIFAPIRQHIRDDVESDHAQLFRAAALASAPGTLPMEVAISTLLSARAVFEATRLWQREMYEYYQLRASTPGRAAL